MPIDRGVIDQQLQVLGEGPGWWELRELRDLPAVLHADERILAISRGRIARRELLWRSWLIVVTDRRLVCLQSVSGTGWRQLEVVASQIGRTTLRVGALRSRVLVSGGGRKFRLRVSRADGYKVFSAISSICTPARSVQGGARPTIMIRRIFNHILDLPAVALDPSAPVPALPAASVVDERVSQLEQEVEELRQQVQFLEQLLREKQLMREAHIL